MRSALVPSISLLEAFEASARHQSFTRAADELALTQSAVSRQVQTLEALLGVTLFQRAGRRIRLTEVGSAYAREITTALARIRSASSRAMSFRPDQGSLQLAIPPTLASKWLLPRLGSFYSRHPGMLIHVHSRVGEIDFARSGLDAGICAGHDHWPGLVSHHLFKEHPVVIVSPQLLARQPLDHPSQLTHCVLLEAVLRPQAWKSWFVAHGLPLRGMRVGPSFEFTAHLIQAVVAGMGVGLVTKVLVEEELRNGTLVVPFDLAVPSRWNYWLVYPPDRANFPPLAAFREWVLDQAQGCESDAAP